MKKIENEGVEILIGTKGYVDLAYPIQMTEKERTAFINLLKKIYDPRIVIEGYVDEFRRDWRIGERILYPREWTEEEYLVLLEGETTRKIVESLGRSWQACELKDADWRYRLDAFCSAHNFDLSKGDKLEIIKKFMREQEEFKKLRKRLREERRALLEEKEKLLSPERKKHWERLKSMGLLGERELTKFKNDELKKIDKRLKKIESELEKDITEV